MFTIVSTVLFIVLFVAWSKSALVDMFIKLGFLFLSLWGLYVLFGSPPINSGVR